MLDQEAWDPDRSHGERASLSPVFVVPKRILFQAVGGGRDREVRDVTNLIRRLRAEAR